MPINKTQVTIFVFAMSATLAFNATAEDFFWINPAGGVFQNGLNWSSGKPPGFLNEAIFNLSSIGGYTVTFVKDDVSLSTVIRNDVVTLDLAGNTFTMGAGDPTSLVVGLSDGDNGFLTLINGQLITITSVIGQDESSEGTMVVSGPGTSWNSIDVIFVGKGGLGSLAILDGAQVFSLEDIRLGAEIGSSGIGSVIGTGSAWDTNSVFRVGVEGFGSVLVENGGSASSLGVTILGEQGGSGEIIVTGLGSSWTVNSGFNVGAHEGYGYLTIMDGATASSDLESSVGEGNNAVGEIVVTGSGSNLTIQERIDIGKTMNAQGTVRVTDGAIFLIDGFAVVGFMGSGTLEIASGGTFTTTAQTFVANQPDSSANISVTNPGSSLNVGGLFELGDHGQSTLMITDGGTVNVQGSSDMATGASAIVNATVSGLGSMWTSADELLVGSSGNATLLIKDFGIVIAQSVSIGDVGLVTGNSVLAGNVQNNGNVSPGVANCSSDVFTIIGNYQQEQNGALTIEIGGTVSGQEYDVLAVTGESALNGTLNLSLFDGFLPQAGQQFEILTTISVAGTFSQIEMPISGQYEVSYDSTSVTIMVTQSAILGDLNGDEHVSTRDLLILFANWGPCDGCCPADLNGDHIVDEVDLQILIDSWSGLNNVTLE